MTMLEGINPTSCTLLLWFSALVVILTLMSLLDTTRIFTADTRILTTMMTACIVMDFCYASSYMYMDEPDSPGFYVFTVLMLVTFFLQFALMGFYITEHIKIFVPCNSVLSWFSAGALAICAAVWIIELFSGQLIIVEKNGLSFQQSSLLRSLVGGGMLYMVLVIQIVLILQYSKDLPWEDSKILVFFYVFPFLGVIIQNYTSLPLLQVGVSFAYLLMYIMLQSENNRRYERELYEMQIKNLYGQIQPHFISNVMGTIYNLCEIDPPRAQEAIEIFSDYLRDNLQIMEANHLIPIEDELNHVLNYLKIAKLRFDHLEYEVKQDTESFSIPFLTVEPLVENAVKHGYSKKKGIRILVHVWKEAENYVIQVSDNGKGFDVGAPENKEEAGHYGIRNVAERLEATCCGSLKLQSVPGEGTEATIYIPAQEE